MYDEAESVDSIVAAPTQQPAIREADGDELRNVKLDFTLPENPRVPLKPAPVLPENDVNLSGGVELAADAVPDRPCIFKQAGIAPGQDQRYHLPRRRPCRC